MSCSSRNCRCSDKAADILKYTLHLDQLINKFMIGLFTKGDTESVNPG